MNRRYAIEIEATIDRMNEHNLPVYAIKADYGGYPSDSDQPMRILNIRQIIFSNWIATPEEAYAWIQGYQAGLHAAIKAALQSDSGLQPF